jgi:hypothetical protein
MLKLAHYDERADEPDPASEAPESLLFPADAVRMLTAKVIPGRWDQFDNEPVDSIHRAEEALRRAERDMDRLRAQFDGSDDRPRAA